MTTMYLTNMKTPIIVFALLPSIVLCEGTCPILNHNLQSIPSLPCVIRNFHRKTTIASECTAVELQCRLVFFDAEMASFNCTDRSDTLSISIEKSLVAFNDSRRIQQIKEHNRTQIVGCRSPKNLSSCVMYQQDQGLDWLYEVKYTEAMIVAGGEGSTNGNFVKDRRLVSTVYSCDCARYGAFFQQQRKRCREDRTAKTELQGYAVYVCGITVLACLAAKIGYDFIAKKCCHRTAVDVGQ